MTTQEAGANRSKLKRLIILIVLVSVGLHVAAGLVAGVVIVARYLIEPPAVFKAVKDIRIAAQDREHRMNMSQFDGGAAKPSFTDRMASARPTEFALPDLPKMPIDASADFDPSGIVTDQLSGLAGLAGAGAGFGSGSGGAGGGKGGSAVEFLGVTGTGQRVVLIFDVSTTVTTALVKAGTPLTAIKDKISELLKALSINTTFNIAQFARQYAFFKPELVPASDPNRIEAQAWLDKWFTTGRGLKRNTPGIIREKTGFLGVLKDAFKLRPDLVYILGDGSFERGEDRGEKIPFDEINSTLRELQKSLDKPATINFIGVGMKDDNRKEIRRIISAQGGDGRFRELDIAEQ